MTFATQQRKIYSAMSVQLDRVNGDGSPSLNSERGVGGEVNQLLRRIRELESELARVKRENARLTNPTLAAGGTVPGYTPTGPRRGGRPVITVYGRCIVWGDTPPPSQRIISWN